MTEQLNTAHLYNITAYFQRSESPLYSAGSTPLIPHHWQPLIFPLSP